MKKEDKLILGGKEFSSRFILGSGKYSLSLIEAAGIRPVPEMPKKRCVLPD